MGHMTGWEMGLLSGSTRLQHMALNQPITAGKYMPHNRHALYFHCAWFERGSRVTFLNESEKSYLFYDWFFMENVGSGWVVSLSSDWCRCMIARKPFHWLYYTLLDLSTYSATHITVCCILLLVNTSLTSWPTISVSLNTQNSPQTLAYHNAWCGLFCVPKSLFEF